MTEQRFYGDIPVEFSNGAKGLKSSSPMDCLGPFTKVKNCPIAGTNLRLTCYATGYADTFFSVPAVTRHRTKRIKGYFSVEDGACVFNPLNYFKQWLPLVEKENG